MKFLEKFSYYYDENFNLLEIGFWFKFKNFHLTVIFLVCYKILEHSTKRYWANKYIFLDFYEALIHDLAMFISVFIISYLLVRYAKIKTHYVFENILETSSGYKNGILSLILFCSFFVLVYFLLFKVGQVWIWKYLITAEGSGEIGCCSSS